MIELHPAFDVAFDDEVAGAGDLTFDLDVLADDGGCVSLGIPVVATSQVGRKVAKEPCYTLK
jgi:hypothetical protein